MSSTFSTFAYGLISVGCIVLIPICVLVFRVAGKCRAEQSRRLRIDSLRDSMAQVPTTLMIKSVAEPPAILDLTSEELAAPDPADDSLFWNSNQDTATHSAVEEKSGQPTPKKSKKQKRACRLPWRDEDLAAARAELATFGLVRITS